MSPDAIATVVPVRNQNEIETLALALVHGDVPADHANAISALTDEEFERLLGNV